MHRSILPYLILLLFSFSACSSRDDDDDDADRSFKELSRSDDFKKLHESPENIGKLALTGKMVDFKAGKGAMAHAYEVKAHAPTKKWLLVFHEWWGLNDHIKKEADRLANQLKDVNVLALDLYDGKVTKDPDEASKLVNDTKDSRIEQIIKGAIAYTGDSAKFATIGWCFGGGWSLQTAILGGTKDVGCVMYYGMPETDTKKIDKIECPVLGIFGTKDKGITPEKVNAFETTMHYLTKPVLIRSFDAEHAFANPSNPHYNKQATAEANVISLKFLKDRYETVE